MEHVYCFQIILCWNIIFGYITTIYALLDSQTGS